MNIVQDIMHYKYILYALIPCLIYGLPCVLTKITMQMIHSINKDLNKQIYY